ncbi:NAD-dependent epimerase/dehydratase family protein [Marinibactrum halimedae]|uniref:UDP-glucose 4-epimerase n=1 Tax=Marinibactrum halimedae TaxID=1444977 RepID=A0AA37WM16_9GAMM|nr:NAD(P)-dependent oxidoreductase [Marinibactrum halimedae]MCD9459689.1 NAD(P)-dependent oxidoreductase [Marinibactrum halimedae]GLS25715.1 UDP-glucose 4-epimerase [Marinibactrum halimedae]
MPTFKHVAVTGGSGSAGQFVINALLESNIDAVNLDSSEPASHLCPYRKVDITDYHQVFDALEDCDAIIHLATNPEPDINFDDVSDPFRIHTLGCFNVFNAAAALNIRKVVWVSSEKVPTIRIDQQTPKYLSNASAQNGYDLSKRVYENLAEQMHTLYGIDFIGFHATPNYCSSATTTRKSNPWAYTDAHNAAHAAVLALKGNITGSEDFIMAANNTIMRRTDRKKLDVIYPEGVLCEGTNDDESLAKNTKAKKILGFEPKHSWRSVLGMTKN